MALEGEPGNYPLPGSHGVCIAHLLYERLEQRLKPWRFDIQDYEKGRTSRKHSTTLSTERIPSDVGVFDALRVHMMSIGDVVYEEDVLNVLLGDLEDYAAKLEADEAYGEEHGLL